MASPISLPSRPRHATAKPRTYSKIHKAPLICMLCTTRREFVDSPSLDAHLHKDHPDWFQKALRNLYVKMRPRPEEL